MHGIERKCPVCEMVEGISINRNSGTNIYEINCPRCGNFQTSLRFLLLVRKWNELEERRYLVSGLIRELNERGEVPKVFSDTIEQLFDHPLIPKNEDIDTKAERILHYLKLNTRGFGKDVVFRIETNLYLAYTKDREELGALLQYLVDEDLIECYGNNISVFEQVTHHLIDPTLKFTAKGWKHVQKVDSPERFDVRFSARTPASNLQIIADLIGSAKIDAVFDPYLDSKGIIILGEILSIGVTATHPLRLLSAMREAELPNSFLTSWLKERSISGELRRMPASEHGRFFLLNNGKSLRIGVSLNGLKTNNEAAHLDPDTEDLAFFDSIWRTAKPFIPSKEEVTAKNSTKEKKANRIIEDWRDWQEEQIHSFNQETKDGYRKMEKEEGFLFTLIRERFFKDFPTRAMIEKKDREKARMRKKVVRSLEDLNFTQTEIEKMIQDNTLT